MFQFGRFPPYTYVFSIRLRGLTRAGFPHSEICGSMAICASPQLIAACRVLLRLPVPRHSPCALISLDFFRSISGSLALLHANRKSFEVFPLRLNCNMPFALASGLPLPRKDLQYFLSKIFLLLSYTLPVYVSICFLLFIFQCTLFRSPSGDPMTALQLSHSALRSSFLRTSPLRFPRVLVGSSGFEPPTLRLSGARSNHLSYEPISLWLGGDEGIRTLDPLLAGQVLSQLSYTPVP